MDPLIFFTLLVLCLSFLGLSWFSGTDAPYVPTKKDRIDKIVKLTQIKKETVFYELGSGDGRIVMAAASAGATAFGVEQSWIRVWFSRYKAWKKKLTKAHFYHGNIFDRNYYPADVVFIYLLSPAVAKLEEKLKKELKESSVVITQTYHFKNWKPLKKEGDFWVYICR